MPVFVVYLIFIFTIDFGPQYCQMCQVLLVNLLTLLVFITSRLVKINSEIVITVILQTCSYCDLSPLDIFKNPLFSDELKYASFMHIL